MMKLLCKTSVKIQIIWIPRILAIEIHAETCFIKLKWSEATQIVVAYIGED